MKSVNFKLTKSQMKAIEPIYNHLLKGEEDGVEKIGMVIGNIIYGRKNNPNCHIKNATYAIAHFGILPRKQGKEYANKVQKHFEDLE